jgi:uncharacterized paraquat-inducible protein A
MNKRVTVVCSNPFLFARIFLSEYISMLRIASTLLLILVYTLSLCRVFVPFLHYVVDREFYSERCENTAKPELDCCGKCQVVKEVQQETECESRHSPHTAPSDDREHIFEAFHLLPHDHFLPAQQISSHIFFIFANSQPVAKGFVIPPFQPPRA